MIRPRNTRSDEHERGASRLCGVRSRASSRGLTLIEIIVVLALIGIVTVAVISGTNQLPSARLKRSAAMLTAAIRVAYTRATATSRNVRIVFDLESQEIWLEESDRPMLVQSKDKSGSGGAAPMTDAEKIAVEEGERIVKGPVVPKPFFKKVDAFGLGSGDEPSKNEGGRPLARGIKFRSVETAHDDEARTVGRAYLYFWPGGLTERASIQVRIGDADEESKTLALIVSPLTGKVTIKQGPVPVAKPLDDKEASEREDNGP